jgi:hypothetical protein
MLKRYDNLFDFQRTPLKLKPPGQKQSEESADRQRDFVKRAAAIADLKNMRLRAHEPIKTEPARRAVKKYALSRG